MRKIFLFLAAALCVFVSCSKEPENTDPVNPAPTPVNPDVPATPKAEAWAIIYNYTSSIRTSCADYVADLKKETDKGKCVALAIKCYGDPLLGTITYSLFHSFQSDRGLMAEIPSYAVGDYDELPYSGVAALCQSLKNRDCEIGVSATSTIKDDVMKVNVKTKNFKALNTSEYYIAVYVLEDSVMYPQSGVGGNFKHDYVIRATNTGTAYQYFGVFENIPKSRTSEYAREYQIDLTHLNNTSNDQVKYKPENTYAAVVIYKKSLDNAPVYKYVNCNWTRK